MPSSESSWRDSAGASVVAREADGDDADVAVGAVDAVAVARAGKGAAAKRRVAPVGHAVVVTRARVRGRPGVGETMCRPRAGVAPERGSQDHRRRRGVALGKRVVVRRRGHHRARLARVTCIGTRSAGAAHRHECSCEEHSERHDSPAGRCGPAGTPMEAPVGHGHAIAAVVSPAVNLASAPSGRVARKRHAALLPCPRRRRGIRDFPLARMRREPLRVRPSRAAERRRLAGSRSDRGAGDGCSVGPAYRACGCERCGPRAHGERDGRRRRGGGDRRARCS